MSLSIVSPVYNSANTIYDLVDEICKAIVVFTNDFDIILVDDGSADNSWQQIENICKNNAKVKGVKLKQNYGQHQAILAGLEQAKGDWMVVLDCDLQDNPAEIPKLFLETKNGFKIIMAKRMNRKDSFLKKWTSFIFWKTLSFLNNTPIHPLVGNFGMYHKDVITQFILQNDTEPYFSIAMQKFKFNRVMVAVEHQARMNEKSSYSIYKLLKHAANVLIYSNKSHVERPSASNRVIHYSIEKIITN